MALLFLTEHELDVGADHTEGLVNHVAALGLDHHAEVVGALRLLALLDEGELLLERGLLLLAALEVLRDFAHEGDGELLEVFAAAHLGVHVFEDEEHGGGDEEAGEQAHEQDVALVGRGGGVAADGWGDDAGVVGSEGLR